MHAYNELVTQGERNMNGKFSDYSKQSLEDLKQKTQPATDQYAQNNPKKLAELNQMLQPFSGMNKEQLFSALMQVVQQKKRDGTLSLDYLHTIQNTLYPYLSPEQKQLFENLLNTIR